MADRSLIKRDAPLKGEVLTQDDYLNLLREHGVASNAYQAEVTPQTARELLKIKEEIVSKFPFSTMGRVISGGPKLLEVLSRESNPRIE